MNIEGSFNNKGCIRGIVISGGMRMLAASSKNEKRKKQ
jgi:hypothetical protein